MKDALKRFVIATAVLAALSAGVSPTATASDAGMAKERARIESVAVQVDESAPPQYSARVEFPLANGCIQPGGFELQRNDDRIRLRVFVLTPNDSQIVCSMIFRTAVYDVPLGAHFVPGHTYTVEVNDRQHTFVAR